jgi:iron complex transport system ATP-binding protein
MEQILTLRNIGFRYEKEWALKGVDLQVNAGEILGILGPNGSGKSTLLKIMDGLLVPEEGEVFMRGASLKDLGRLELAREVAMVAQENYFRFSFSCLEVVLMGRFPHLKSLQFEGERDLNAAIDALTATHALEFSDRSINDLSGGERQRVLLARALAQEPSIILLDEPTSFLDLKYKREVFRMIHSLRRDKALGVVIVTHDIDLIAQYCHRLIMMKNGYVYETGDPEKVITAANIEEVYECPVLVDRNPLTGRPRINLV